MPAIKYKKKTYAGATFPVLEMTKAEYDALPDAKKMDGTVYMITDDYGGWEAERSTYDNTTSGLTATNVQAALDEIVSPSRFLTKRTAVVNDSTGIAANASKTYTPSPLTVSGYRPIMFSYLGGPYMDFCTFNFGDTVISGNSITFGTFYVVNRSTTNLPALMVMMQSLWVPISG